MKLKKRLNEIIAKHTGKPLDIVEKDTDRDYFMSAEEAISYGLVDKIITKSTAVPTGDKK
jgi:ATP-dependent Clp protease, protease subunit